MLARGISRQLWFVLIPGEPTGTRTLACWLFSDGLSLGDVDEHEQLIRGVSGREGFQSRSFHSGPIAFVNDKPRELYHEGVMGRGWRVRRLMARLSDQRGEAGHLARRMAKRPHWELRRIWAYCKLDAREAFIDFQSAYIDHQCLELQKLRVARHQTPPSRSSTAVTGDSMAGGATDLGELLRSHGSDKASRHDYNVIYEAVSVEAGMPRLVFEIGIGTNAVRASSMGSEGSPGASARAFRDWGARVIACDIDRSVLFSEDGIETFYVDQLCPSTFRQSVARAAALGGIDLAVIDGLHTPEADLNSLIALSPHLSGSGVLVVEDVEPVPAVLDMWRNALTYLNPAFSSALVETKASWVVLLGPAGFWKGSELAALYR